MFISLRSPRRCGGFSCSKHVLTNLSSLRFLLFLRGFIPPKEHHYQTWKKQQEQDDGSVCCNDIMSAQASSYSRIPDYESDPGQDSKKGRLLPRP